MGPRSYLFSEKKRKRHLLETEAVFNSPLYEKGTYLQIGPMTSILECGMMSYYSTTQFYKSTPATFSGNCLQINLRGITSFEFKKKAKTRKARGQEGGQ